MHFSYAFGKAKTEKMKVISVEEKKKKSILKCLAEYSRISVVFSHTLAWQRIILDYL